MPIPIFQQNAAPGNAPELSPRTGTWRRLLPGLALFLATAVTLPAQEAAPAETEAPAAIAAVPPETPAATEPAPASSAQAPAAEGPTVLTPTVPSADAVGTIAPLPGLRPEPTAAPVSSVEIPLAKPELQANGELPNNFDELSHDDRLRLLVDQRVQASAILLKDAHTGEVLFARDIDGQYPPASVTKLLTALLCYEVIGMDGVVSVTTEDTKVEPSHVPLIAGEQVRSRDLLYSLLIGSDNDSAMALGRTAAGSMPKFTEMMDRYAAALGCTHSSFKNPNGLPAEGHLSTAADLMKIFERVLARPELRNICFVQQFPLSTQCGTQIVKNHNKLLGRYIGMGPAKTGWTRASQHTYAACVTRGNRTFLLTLLKSPNKWFDARLLFDYAFSVRPADPATLPEGVPAIPLVLERRNLVTMPGGEVTKGHLPPEGLVVITNALPGSLGTAKKVTLKDKDDDPAGLASGAVAEGDEEPAAARFGREPGSGVPHAVPVKVTPGAHAGVLQSSDGTSYLASSGEEEEAPLPSGFKLRDYTIRSGDTLATIASKYGCSVAMIEECNKIPNRHRIVPGQHLKVPQKVN